MIIYRDAPASSVMPACRDTYWTMRGDSLLRSRCSRDKAIAIVLALMLAVSGLLLSSPYAHATGRADLAIKDAETAVSSSKLSLEEAKSRLDQITAEYNVLNAEIDDMQSKIDSLSEQVLEAQAAMLEGRDALSDTAVYEYRNNTMTTMLNILLGSQNISELTTNMSYISQIMDHQAKEIATQKQLKSELETASEELNAQKNEQESKLAELDRKQSEAQNVVDHVSQEYAANTEYLNALKAQADALRRAEAQATQEVDPGATTINRPSSSGSGGGTPSQGQTGSTGSTGTGSSGTTSNGGNTSGGTSSSGEGWRTGLATAYGGSSDPYTPNPGKTATGAICNDYSVGVAVPMAWPNYRSYLGRTVEIVYNGKTVYAPVNDCGGMQGGRVSLDLQPGVFKAFGFSNCNAWGIRTVQYRFL